MTLADFRRALSGPTRKSRFRSLQRQNTTSALESLEHRVLLAAQVITPDPGTLNAVAGEEVAFDVQLDTDPTDTLSNGLAFAFHFDSTKLTFVRLENVFQTSLFAAPGDLQDDTANDDGIAETDKKISNTWSSFTNVNFPGTLPVTLFRAVFTANASFDSGSTQIGFSQTNAANDATGQPFTFTSTTATINGTSAPAPVQVISPNPITQNVVAGDEVAFDVSLDTDPADTLSNGLAFAFHFDSTKLTFDRLENVFQTSLFAAPGDLQDDTTNDDGIADTDKKISNSWSSFTNVNFPGTLPVTLFRAVFTANASFDSGATQIGFSQTNASNDATGQPFDFRSTNATINGQPMAVDAAPTAVADNFNVRTGNTLTGNVLTNDSDPEDAISALVAAVVTDVTNGTLALNADGSFTYTPNAGFTGTDTFEYSVTDTANNSATGTATITVVDTPDIAGDGNVTVKLRRGDLRILGDNGNNSIQITGTGATVTIVGLGNTTINGSTDTLVLNTTDLSDDVLIRMRRGNDTVIISDLTVADNMGVSMGAGNDVLEIYSVQGQDDLRIGAGRGDDTVAIVDSTFNDNVRIVGSGGSDQIATSNSVVGDDLRIVAGPSADTIIVDRTTVQDNAIVRGGGAADSVIVSDSTVNGDARFVGGGGKDVAQTENVAVAGRTWVRSAAASNTLDSLFSQRRDDFFDSLLFGPFQRS